MKTSIPLSVFIGLTFAILIDVAMGLHFSKFMRIAAGILAPFLVLTWILHVRQYARIIAIAMRAAGIKEI